MSAISTPNTYKVCISSGKDSVIFEASVPVGESRQANYVGYDIVHSPTEILAYKNTSSRKFQISGKIISRTPDEATVNAHYINLIRSWLLPDFGGSGATPPILVLSAFSNSNIKNVQCVLKSYTISYPDDVDWIFMDFEGNTLNDPMPVVFNVQVDLDEIYTPAQVTNKAWKINVATTPATYSLGRAYGDNSSAGGGQAQQTTPQVSDVPTGGIAHENANASAGNLLGTKSIGPTLPGQGNNSSVLGMSNDGAFSSSTTFSSPVNGLNSNLIDQNSAPQAFTGSTTNTIGNVRTFSVPTPTRR